MIPLREGDSRQGSAVEMRADYSASDLRRLATRTKDVGQSRTFIDSAIRADHIPTVVVTHHLPHEGSVAERFKGDLLSAAFASLTDMIEAGRPALWVHGDSHVSCDYPAHQTRIVATQGVMGTITGASTQGWW